MPSEASSSDRNPHSAPIPINTAVSKRSRPRSESESSESDSAPPLSPSHSPSSSTSFSIPSPYSSTRVPLSPTSPSTSPIMSFLYNSPNKTPFSRPPGFDDDDIPEPPTAKPHARRMSTSWLPPRFAQQQQSKPGMDQQDRGAGILRRLSISTPLSGVTSKPHVPFQSADGGTKAGPNTGPPGQRRPRKAATLSPPTPGTTKPRAPSPMGERMLKGHYDGF